MTELGHVVAYDCQGLSPMAYERQLKDEFAAYSLAIRGITPKVERPLAENGGLAANTRQIETIR